MSVSLSHSPPSLYPSFLHYPLSLSCSSLFSPSLHSLSPAASPASLHPTFLLPPLSVCLEVSCMSPSGPNNQIQLLLAARDIGNLYVHYVAVSFWMNRWCSHNWEDPTPSLSHSNTSIADSYIAWCLATLIFWACLNVWSHLYGENVCTCGPLVCEHVPHFHTQHLCCGR